MKACLSIFTALLLLAACETNQQDKEAIKAQAAQDVRTVESNAKRHSMRIANNVRDQVKTTSMKLREWWLTPPENEIPRPVPPSYCYRVMQDILCYRDPMPGQTHMLVGYQGDDVAPPPLAQTKALPASRVQKQAASTTGAARVANAKPVFVSIPTQAKEDTDGTLSATPQVGSEPLPDPALSPQL
jgi:hypothetical protein